MRDNDKKIAPGGEPGAKGKSLTGIASPDELRCIYEYSTSDAP
jgi:hypothetical protein